ncbi:uncharacterized protein ACA1_216330 [Acanthamoeba castellanii str. Neff]|uniref:Uncharacterized protein n=1 Tax=Acanthamoeba castellanii (strain ATCC 30010 / Neff) TaxID=1257118 RepID=L8GSQ0_ACACF|nr:uncharacterized protein ACA1_216330 [Acanthamoeba castellanii str. Neff]ELR15131.1 hypothetical protein ACA1_216330 [Acanthamoeba castellanii str. Neff]
MALLSPPPHKHADVGNPSSPPQSKKKRRSPYKCHKCGKPKKGHICTAVDPSSLALFKEREARPPQPAYPHHQHHPQDSPPSAGSLSLASLAATSSALSPSYAGVSSSSSASSPYSSSLSSSLSSSSSSSSVSHHHHHHHLALPTPSDDWTMRVVEGDEADMEAANGGQGLRRRRKSGASGTTTTKKRKKKRGGGGQRRRGSRSSRGANSGEGLPGDHTDDYEEDEAEIDEDDDEDGGDQDGEDDEDDDEVEEGDLLAAGEEVMGAGVSRRNLVPFLGDMAALYNTSSDNLFPTDALSRYELSGSNPMEAAAYGSGSSWANWGALGETPAAEEDFDISLFGYIDERPPEKVSGVGITLDQKKVPFFVSWFEMAASGLDMLETFLKTQRPAWRALPGVLEDLHEQKRKLNAWKDNFGKEVIGKALHEQQQQADSSSAAASTRVGGHVLFARDAEVMAMMLVDQQQQQQHQQHGTQRGTTTAKRRTPDADDQVARQEEEEREPIAPPKRRKNEAAAAAAADPLGSSSHLAAAAAHQP